MEERPATKRQLWALFLASKKNGIARDYRKDNLSMAEAGRLLRELNAKADSANDKKKSLEKEFIEFMGEKMQGIISTAKDAARIESVVEDDPSLLGEGKKGNRYSFFGYGCGITVISYDKRSRIGKEISELSDKHRMTTFLSMFEKGFTKEQLRHYESVGFPLQAMYYQDIRVSGGYESAVAAFMEKKGVRNVRTRTYYD